MYKNGLGEELFRNSRGKKRAADMRQKSSHIIGDNTLPERKKRKSLSNENKYLN